MRKLSMLVAGVAMIAVSAPRAAQAQDKDIVETAGKVMAAEALKTQGKGVKTVEGQDIKITVMGGKPMVNGAHIVTTDIVAKNGVIHVIDAVILPPAK